MRERRKFTNEFKLEAVKLAESGDRPVAQVARELGLNETTLHRWMNRYGQRAGAGRMTPEEHEELIRLRREVRRVTEERDIPKKSAEYLLQGTAVRYSFIRQHRGQFRLAALCRVLRVSTSGYFAWLKRPESARARRNRELAVQIKVVHARSRKTYGRRRIHAQLRREGIVCSPNRVGRLMRSHGICGLRRRRFKATTNSRHSFPVAPNLLARDFTAAPDQVWVSDITYLGCEEGWEYLATVMDLYSRRIVGWAMQSTLDRSLTLNALKMAISQRRPAPGLIHHSDRGVQYACGDYQTALNDHHMIPSMSRKGDCWDNAPKESFIGTLKCELSLHELRPPREEAHRKLFEYIEVFYNRQRLHSSLGYRAPVEFERLSMVKAA